jgi:hypothetical protein
MPTGIEEAIAALVAAASAAAALSPFTTPPDAQRQMQPTADAGAFGADVCLPDAEDYDGSADQSIDPGIAGTDQPSAPVTGDAPRLSSTGKKIDIELEMVIVGHPPAADAAPGEKSEAPPSPASFESPHAGEAEPSEPEPPAPPAAGPYLPDHMLNPEVAADYADQWQFVSSVMPSGLGGAPFGITGEEYNEHAKRKFHEFLNEYIDDMKEGDPEGSWSDPVGDATIVGTVGDVFIDMASVVIDPPFVIRGFMRMGTGTSQGLDEIEAGKTVEGSMKIVSEVSSAILIVTAPIEPAPRTATMTMYGPEALFNPRGTVHNVVKVETAGGGEMATHAVRSGPKGDVAAAMEYSLETLRMNADDYANVPRAVSERGAQNAVAEAQRAHAGSYRGVPGGIGPYGEFQHHCSTYAATISTAGGIPITGVFGPRITLLMFQYFPEFANPTFGLITGGGSSNANATANANPASPGNAATPNASP